MIGRIDRMTLAEAWRVYDSEHGYAPAPAERPGPLNVPGRLGEAIAALTLARIESPEPDCDAYIAKALRELNALAAAERPQDAPRSAARDESGPAPGWMVGELADSTAEKRVIVSRAPGGRRCKTWDEAYAVTWALYDAEHGGAPRSEPAAGGDEKVSAIRLDAAYLRASWRNRPAEQVDAVLQRIEDGLGDMGIGEPAAGGDLKCEGFAARWCARCGNCTCTMEEWEQGEYARHCPLHGRDTAHAPDDDGEPAAGERGEVEREAAALRRIEAEGVYVEHDAQFTGPDGDRWMMSDATRSAFGHGKTPSAALAALDREVQLRRHQAQLAALQPKGSDSDGG